MNKPITYAYLETTNYCNLECSFCNRNEVIGPLQHMSVTKFRELMEKIKHHPIEEAKLMGMGEPMLHPIFLFVVDFKIIWTRYLDLCGLQEWS